MPNYKKVKIREGGLRHKEANKKDQFNYNLCSSHELIKENFADKDDFISFILENPSH